MGDGILRRNPNAFYDLYEDAAYLLSLSYVNPRQPSSETSRFARAAILLYALSLEALINRALDAFLPINAKGFAEEQLERLSVEQKWFLLPLLSSASRQTFDRSRYPWSAFTELISLRNDWVHPKPTRTTYYQRVNKGAGADEDWVFEPIDWQNIPAGSGLREKQLVYRQLRIPRDPSLVVPANAQGVKKLVDDLIAELDRLLEGRLSKDDWLSKWNARIEGEPGSEVM